MLELKGDLVAPERGELLVLYMGLPFEMELLRRHETPLRVNLVSDLIAGMTGRRRRVLGKRYYLPADSYMLPIHAIISRCLVLLPISTKYSAAPNKNPFGPRGVQPVGQRCCPTANISTSV